MRVIGTFEIDIDGEVSYTKNLVVDGGKKLILRLLTGETYPLETLKVGSSSTTESNFDTDLLSSLGSAKKIDNFILGGTELVCETSFGYNEAVGTIREVGIFAKDGTLFARKVVADRTKSDTQTMKVRYRVEIKGE